MIRRWLGRSALPLFTYMMVSANPALALDEVHVYGVANFGNAGECGTSTDSTHARHTETAAEFVDIFEFYKIYGLWDDVYTRNNQSANGKDWTDSSKGSTSDSCCSSYQEGCDCVGADNTDKYGADDADVVFIHTHGGHGDDYVTLSMGDVDYDCSLNSKNDFLFGGSGADLDIAVVKACQAGDYDVWKAGGFGLLRDSTDLFTMWNAFHGDSSCSSATVTYIGAYSDNSASDGVGENWIDEAWDNESSANQDDCPVSIVFGSDNTTRMNMYNYGGWLDRKDTGTRSGSTIVYVGGCDPSNGTVLPN